MDRKTFLGAMIFKEMTIKAQVSKQLAELLSLYADIQEEIASQEKAHLKNPIYRSNREAVSFFLSKIKRNSHDTKQALSALGQLKVGAVPSPDDIVEELADRQKRREVRKAKKVTHAPSENTY